MRASKFIGVLSCAILCSLNTFAQQQADSILDLNQVDIFKPYQPILADAVKINFSPELPKTTVEPIKLTYDLPTKLLSVSVQKPDIKPITLPKQKVKEYIPILYAKLGFGNYTSPFANIFYTNSSKSKFKYGVELFHHSVNSSPIASQRFAKSYVQVNGTYLTTNHLLTAGIKYTNSIYRPYSQEISTNKPLTDLDKFVFDKIEPTFSFAKLNKDFDYSWSYKTQLNPYFLTKKDSLATCINESGIDWNSQISKSWKGGHQFLINVIVQTNQLKEGVMVDKSSGSNQYTGFAFNLKNTLTTINPIYNYSGKDWHANLGMNLALDSKLYFFPDIQLDKNMIQNVLTGFAGYQGTIQKNSYRNFQLNNPFMDVVLLQNTHKTDLFIGAKGLVNKTLNYLVKGSLLKYNQLPFMADSNKVIRNYTAIYQATSTIFNAHAELGYNKNDLLKINGVLDYYNFYTPKYSYNYSFPTFQFGLNASYKFENKLDLKGALVAWNAFPQYNNTGTIKGAADLSLEGVYHYNENVDAFLSINNILNTKYQRLPGYPVYGINGLIGVILKY